MPLLLQFFYPVNSNACSFLCETEKRAEESSQNDAHQTPIDGTSKRDSLNRKHEQVQIIENYDSIEEQQRKLFLRQSRIVDCNFCLRFICSLQRLEAFKPQS